MKFKVEGYTGPNTVFGKGGKVLARIAVNVTHPAVGSDVEVDDAETREPSKTDSELIAAAKAGAKAKDETSVKVPDSEPPKK